MHNPNNEQLRRAFELCQAFSSERSCYASSSRDFRLLREHLPLPSVMVWCGLKPVLAQPCPFKGHPYNGGQTETAFTIFWDAAKGCYVWYCHNAECHLHGRGLGFKRHGDVIDFYQQIVAQVSYISIQQAAKRLLGMMKEELFDLGVKIDGRSIKTHKTAATRGSSGIPADDPIRLMEGELVGIKPDKALIESIASVGTLQQGELRVLSRFTVRSICRVIWESYSEDAWVCASTVKNGGYLAMRKADWLKDCRLKRQSFIFPIGYNEKRAWRVNTMQRKWAIIESDDVGKEYQVSLLMWLAQRFPRMPLELVVDSRNRSFHGWFWLGDVSQEEYFQMFRMARKLGCDPKTIRPELRCRMPNGRNRLKSQKQAVVWMSDEFRSKLKEQRANRFNTSS